ncbi:MAG: cellulase family glycosylhydrolase, partial [Candidatus Omnitrophica bacterium]|nr:cellulase family glycosylhydrolase [Candidatus Omnitrophota bacterium]
MKRIYLLMICVSILTAGSVIQPAWANFTKGDKHLDLTTGHLTKQNIRMASDNKGNIHVVWIDVNDPYTIYYNRSEDYGHSWFPIEQTFTTSIGETYLRDLDVNVDTLGNVYISYVARFYYHHTSLKVRHSSNYGEDWSSYEILFGLSGNWLGWYDFANDQSGNVCMAAYDFGEFAQNISVSCNQAEAVIINSAPAGANHTQDAAKIDMDEQGHIYVIWQDSRDAQDNDRAIYINYSHNYGQTWGTDQELYPPVYQMGGSEPSIVAGENGHVYAVWSVHDVQQDIHGIYYSKSDDYGVSWTTAMSLAQDANTPELAQNNQGDVYLAWLDVADTYKEVKIMHSSDYGNTWGSIQQPSNTHNADDIQLFAGNDRVFVAWDNQSPWQGIFYNYSEDNGLTWQGQDYRVDNNTGETIGTDLQKAALQNDNVFAVWVNEDTGQLHDIFFNVGDFNGYSVKTYQNFEDFNGSDVYGWDVRATSYLSNERAHTGNRSWKIETDDILEGTAIAAQEEHWTFDLNPARNDRLTFWIWADPSNAAPNNVGIKFFDHNQYVWDPGAGLDGYTVWTTRQAQYQQWTKLEVLYSQLPPNLEFDNLDKIEIYNYWDGTYFIDDIRVEYQDRAYNSFEHCLPNDPSTCGWIWHGTVSVDQSMVYAGQQAWRVETTEEWGGTGIIYQDRTYTPSGESEWHVNLHPDINDTLSFWIYAEPSTEMDLSIHVELFDFDDSGIEDTVPVQIEVNKSRAIFGQWSKIELPFEDILNKFNEEIATHQNNTTFDLNNINKIQLLFRRAGTYYIDDIRATRQNISIDKMTLRDGLIQWDPIPTADLYHVQHSLNGTAGPWETLYYGEATLFQYHQLHASYIRMRWEHHDLIKRPYLYQSQWSKPIHYLPKPVLIKTDALAQGVLDWNPIQQTTEYEVQSATSIGGQWTTIFTGSYPGGLTADTGIYYRVRGLPNSKWSPVQIYDPGQQFLKTNGTVLRRNNGTGNSIQLAGFNLGSYLLIESWMTQLGHHDDPGINDDWTIRDTLTQRFGQETSDNLMDIFEDAYITDMDLDILFNANVNLVRLPLFYRNFESDDGTINPDAFNRLDQLVLDLADRGIYVLLDMHGAPGAQSAEHHTGRANFNKLFETDQNGAPTADSLMYRNRTIALWQRIANHYKDNPYVLGYDLLNEPIGYLDHYPDIQQAHQAIWAFYDQLYDAIRLIDSNHIIMMEGTWDWDSLPDPVTYGWDNVVYQFHYYLFIFGPGGEIIGGVEDLTVHQNEIGQFINDNRQMQAQYNIPVMIGEFNAFSNKDVWEYYLSSFNAENYLWTIWSYKINASNEWGIVNHSLFDDDWPRLTVDSLSDLERKFQKFTTTEYHQLNESFNDLVKEYLPANQYQIRPLEILYPENGAIVQPYFTLTYQINEAGTVRVYNGPILYEEQYREAGIHTYTTDSQYTGYGTPFSVELETPTGNTYRESVVVYVKDIGIMQIPAPGGIIDNPNTYFKWTIAPEADLYQVILSYDPPQADGSMINIIKEQYDPFNYTTIYDIPLIGSTLYVRLGTRIQDTWLYEYYTYQTAALITPAEMLSPLPGSDITSTTVTFTWDNGVDVISYELKVGTTIGGDDIYQLQTTSTSSTVYNIPSTPQILYVRLSSFDGVLWHNNDYQYNIVTPELASILTPTPDTLIDTKSVTFTWDTGTGVTS